MLFLSYNKKDPKKIYQGLMYTLTSITDLLIYYYSNNKLHPYVNS